MDRAVRYERFGGPEVLDVKEVPTPRAGPGQIRVRVLFAGLNPMDWGIASRSDLAAAFGITVPAGFGSDYSGVVDEVGDGVQGFSVGDRVFGNAIGHAVADHVIVTAPNNRLWHTPSGVDDATAATLTVAGLTASAALEAVRIRPGETLLIGGAAGGVGLFAVQLARNAGATVVGTSSTSTFDFLATLGALPVSYGPGLAERVAEIAPHGLSAAIDLFGTEAVDAAISLGVPADRISVVAVGMAVPPGVHETGAARASAGAMRVILDELVQQTLTVPIAALFPVAQIREAVTLQADRHTHGKIVVALNDA